jgi:LuxR family transcriptional regulator, maltose regulon positive regulatory protein
MIDTLTAKERRVMEHLVQGYKNREIAEQLHISDDLVDYRLRRIFSKLEVNNRVSAAVRFTVAMIDSAVKRTERVGG